MPVPQQRRQQIFDDAALAGLALVRGRHARRETDGLVLGLHFRALKRDAGGIDQLLVLRRQCI
jgi:hypothetical protein